MAIAWVTLELDLEAFDPEPFLSPLPASIRVVALPELGDGEGPRRSIYELNKECAADIPERGEFFSWADYELVRFDVPQFRPDGQVLAVADDELVGLCQVSQHPGAQWAFVEMTGVLRDWRGHGIATALKVTAINVARSWARPSCEPCITR